MPNPTNFLSHRSYSVVKIEGDSFTIVRVTSMPTSASPKTRQGFDYTSLDTATSQFVQRQTGEIRILAQRTIQDIYDIGQKLLWVKEKIGHGRFLDWLAAEVGWSERNAQRFMNVAEGINKRLQGKSAKLSDLNLDLSALYYATAPSTPEPAWEEIFGRAIAGERINYTKTQQVKQKHTAPATQPKLKQEIEPKREQEAEPEPAKVKQFTPNVVPQSPQIKQEIIAILPRKQPGAVLEPKSVSDSFATTTSLPQQSASLPQQPGSWWRLGRHWLYCGDPNSPEFLGRLPEQVNLVLTFPPTPTWQSQVQAKAPISLPTPSSPQGNNLTMFEDMVELMLLLYSGVGDTVVHNYIPLIESFWVIDRLNRRNFLAEPDSRRVAAVISEWKGAGLKVERVN